MTSTASIGSEPSTRHAVGSFTGFFAHHGVWAPGVRLFRRLRFSAKALVISLAIAAPLLALLCWQHWQHSADALQARKDATRQHVEVAHSILVWAHAQELSGKMTRGEAQAIAKSSIAALRYDTSEYFWINDMTPRVVMHPIKADLIGKDVSDLKDPNGLQLFKAFVFKVQEAGRGFVAYQWPKQGNTVPVDKLSYVQGFAPWGWIVGSGIYVDDLREADLRQIQLDAAIVIPSLLLAAYLFLSFYRVMLGGLEETRRHLRLITSGDLTTTPSPWGNDEAAQLMLDLASMQESLRHMVSRVRYSSDEILQSSSEIASGALDLSARTENAAASLQESAASMEQISATVQHTYDSTSEAARVASENARLAADGGLVMQDVVRTMDSIRSSSNRIADIVGTIDSIAFQTNILALNASVEAARAGEQGRGFAVVASEVRVLAQRSATAAREVRSLIGASVDQVESGTQIVHLAGSTISGIVTASERVNHLLADVAVGAREQALGISQIEVAVQELDRMTQQNAALVEQAASASASMKQQATALAEEVTRFRLPSAELA